MHPFHVSVSQRWPEVSDKIQKNFGGGGESGTFALSWGSVGFSLGMRAGRADMAFYRVDSG